MFLIILQRNHRLTKPSLPKINADLQRTFVIKVGTYENSVAFFTKEYSPVINSIIDIADTAPNATHVPQNKNLPGKLHSICGTELHLEKATRPENEFILNLNRVDFPPSKPKQQMAISAVSVLSHLRKQLEKPSKPVSLLLNTVAQYGETANADHTFESAESIKSKKKFRKVSIIGICLFK